MSQAAGYRALVTLAWPIVLARSAQSVIGFCDAAMVAPLGDDALAAATTGALNAMSLLVLPMGLVLIVQSFAAQLAGAGDLAGARRYAWYGLILSAISSALAILALPAIDPALALTGHAPAVREAMSDYMEIRMLSVGLVVGTEALGNWFAGLGDTRVSMRASVVAMLVNIALNWVLIYGHLGAPALGVPGAAWASLLASAAGFAVAGLAFWRARKRDDLVVAVAPIEHPLPVLEASREDRLRLGELARMVRFGLPNGMNWFLEFAAFLVFINFIVAELGTVAVAALMAVSAVNSVSFMPAFGISSAGAVLVGQAIGGDRRGAVPGIVWRTFTTVALWQGLVGLAYFLFPSQIMQLFARSEVTGRELAGLAATFGALTFEAGPVGVVPNDLLAAFVRDEVLSAGAVAELGAILLAISAAWQLLDATVMTLSEALRAAGDTASTLLYRLLIAWFVWLPVAFVAVFVAEGGAVGATWSMVVYFAILALVLVLRFRGGAWRRIDLTGMSPGT